MDKKKVVKVRINKKAQKKYPLPMVKDGRQWNVYINKKLIKHLKIIAKMEQKNINHLVNEVLAQYAIKFNIPDAENEEDNEETNLLSNTQKA